MSNTPLERVSIMPSMQVVLNGRIKYQWPFKYAYFDLEGHMFNFSPILQLLAHPILSNWQFCIPFHTDLVSSVLHSNLYNSFHSVTSRKYLSVSSQDCWHLPFSFVLSKLHLLHTQRSLKRNSCRLIVSPN